MGVSGEEELSEVEDQSAGVLEAPKAGVPTAHYKKKAAYSSIFFSGFSKNATIGTL